MWLVETLAILSSRGWGWRVEPNPTTTKKRGLLYFHLWLTFSLWKGWYSAYSQRGAMQLRMRAEEYASNISTGVHLAVPQYITWIRYIITKECGTLAKIQNKTKVFALSEGFCKNTKNRLAPKIYHLTQAELGTSDRIPIFRYSDSYRTKYHLSDIGLTCLSDFNNRISYIGLPIVRYLSELLKSIGQNGEFLLIFTSFFKNFSPFWRLFGEFSRKLMTWLRPYYAVGVHIVLLASILCCWSPCWCYSTVVG